MGYCNIWCSVRRCRSVCSGWFNDLAMFSLIKGCRISALIVYTYLAINGATDSSLELVKHAVNLQLDYLAVWLFIYCLSSKRPSSWAENRLLAKAAAFYFCHHSIPYLLHDQHTVSFWNRDSLKTWKCCFPSIKLTIWKCSVSRLKQTIHSFPSCVKTLQSWHKKRTLQTVLECPRYAWRTTISACLVSPSLKICIKIILTDGLSLFRWFGFSDPLGL